eukprot:11181264-Heterocapsa_arctica.AAC.1
MVADLFDNMSFSNVMRNARRDDDLRLLRDEPFTSELMIDDPANDAESVASSIRTVPSTCTRVLEPLDRLLPGQIPRLDDV